MLLHLNIYVAADEPPATAYGAPKLDEFKLIVEEIGMGKANIQKTEMGSEISLLLLFVSYYFIHV